MTTAAQPPSEFAAAHGSATCGWLYMSGRKCGKPAIAKWTVMSSTLVCKCHAQEVNRMRMGKLTMLSPNDKLTDAP
mgnify:CR=1 FL=1